MLWTLERQMHRRGHDTAVAACVGSRVAGRLIATGEVPRERDAFEERDREHQQAIQELLQTEAFDLVHDKSGSFFANRETTKPLLASVHLPRSFYANVAWEALPNHIRLNCVSAAQAKTFRDVPNVCGWVRNGIEIDRFPFRSAKDNYLLWLGRICEEKAPHLAIEVARRTGRRLVLAGQVYPFRYHEDYFARAVAPNIGKDVTFIDSPGFEQKVELLANASALLIPSMVDETSSLVAMEAMACGTPVLAFRRGALPEIVDDEFTGFIVDDVASMAEAVGRVKDIQPADCRDYVEQHFSAERMASDYEALYRRILGEPLGRAA